MIFRRDTADDREQHGQTTARRRKPAEDTDAERQMQFGRRVAQEENTQRIERTANHQHLDWAEPFVGNHRDEGDAQADDQRLQADRKRKWFDFAVAEGLTDSGSVGLNLQVADVVINLVAQGTIE